MKYNYILYPVLCFILYSQYIIYKRKFTLIDSLILSSSNMINPLMNLKKRMPLNTYFSKVSLIASGISTIILLITYLIYKDKHIEHDTNEYGIKDLLTLNDLIEKDNIELAKENLILMKYSNEIIN